MVQIGTFNGSQGEQYPLFLYGVVVQQNNNTLVPRGGNFLTNSMVSTNKQFLTDFLPDTFTNFGGLAQPRNIPTPAGYHIRWIYEAQYNVVGYVFLKNGERLEGSFDTEAEANQHIIENILVLPPDSVKLNLFPITDITLAHADYKTPNDNRLNIQLATHSITYVEQNALNNRLSKVSYNIFNSQGKTVVSIFQITGTKAAQYGGEFGNNHPDKKYLPNLIDDCNLYLPFDDYRIVMKNIGEVPIIFEVYSPDKISSENVYLKKQTLSAGQEDSFTLLRANYENLQPWNRAKKINCNNNNDAENV